MGYIIGDEKNGLFYFSFGPNVNASSLSFLSGSNFQGKMIGARISGTIDQFLLTGNEEYKGKIVVFVTDENGTELLGFYDYMAKIETSESQDIDMILNSLQQISDIRTGKSNYNLYIYNCADAALQAAKAGDIQVDDALTPVSVFNNMKAAGAKEVKTQLKARRKE